MTETNQNYHISEQDSHLILNHAVEVIGKVNGDMTIKEFASTDFGTNIGTHTHFLEVLLL